MKKQEIIKKYAQDKYQFEQDCKKCLADALKKVDNKYDVFENISIESSDKLIENDFMDLIAEQMPGYAIELWDMDEYNNELTAVVSNYIIAEAQDGKTDIQYAEWNTDNMDAYYAVVASKK